MAVGLSSMVGHSPAFDAMLAGAAKVAPTHGWVLLQGENGVGKDTLARRIHQASRRAEAPFVALSCAAVPDELVESELFGHERGAYTGAERSRAGVFERADGGTLYLDEVADMDLKMQAKLLRVLQEGQVCPVGGNTPIRVDVRVISSTNQDLEALVASGAFRTDLYYRLAVIPLQVPALRERRLDIPTLAEKFRADAAESNGLPGFPLSDDVQACLLAYAWPGNIRELKNSVERAVIMAGSRPVTLADLPEQVVASASVHAPTHGELEQLTSLPTLREARHGFEREYLRVKLVQFGGNVSRTALAVGLERSNLHRKIKKYGLQVTRTKSDS